MILLLFFFVRFDLRPTILQLITTVVLFVLDVPYKLVISADSIMPVTTQSKSRLLTQSPLGSSIVPSLSTSSSSEPLRALNLSTNSTIESSKVPSTSKFLPSETTNTTGLSLLHHLPRAPNISIAPDKISTATDEFQNLEFQNNSFSNSNAGFTTFSHKFELSTTTIMESDCEDDEKVVQPSPTMVDIAKLITSLSQQISNQSNFIQDQLLQQQRLFENQATTDLKLQQVLQANENFKRDVK